MLNTMEMLTVAERVNGVGNEDEVALEGMDDLISSGATVVGPEEARQMLAMWPYAGQRPLDMTRVKLYVQTMKNNQFYSMSDLEVAHAPDENGLVRGHLINGQHRLNAVIEADMQILFAIKHIRCEDMKEVGERYSVIDIQKIRTLTDGVRSLDLHTQWLVPSNDARALLHATQFLNVGFRKTKRASMLYEKREIAEPYAFPLRVFLGYVAGGVRQIVKQLKRQAPLAVAMVTVREARQVYGDEVVRDFWHGIAQDNGLVVGDPRKAAVRHLYDIGQQNAKKVRSDDSEYTARLIAVCFNHWVKGKQLIAPKILDTHAPMVLEGTSYTKKRAS